MKFQVSERLLLLNILPAEGNIVTLRILRDLKDSLGLTEEEIKKINLRQDGTQVTWDNSTYSVDIQVGEKAMDIIVDSLTRLNNTNKLTEQHIPLYERFVEKKKED